MTKDEVLSSARLAQRLGCGTLVLRAGEDHGLTRECVADLVRDVKETTGVGPYVPHPSTPLGRGLFPVAAEGEQVPAGEETTTKVVALSRLVRPDASIPSTTALATLGPSFGRERGLLRGANVVMPDLTPSSYRALYEIDPGRAAAAATAEAPGGLSARVRMIGRFPGTGTGSRRGSGMPAVLQERMA